jgi:hypothetical protein
MRTLYTQLTVPQQPTALWEANLGADSGSLTSKYVAVLHSLIRTPLWEDATFSAAPTPRRLIVS